MIDIFNVKDDIVKVLFYLNLILLLIGIFVSSKTYFISAIVINTVFTGAFVIICKYSAMFMQQRNGVFGDLLSKVGNAMDNLNTIEVKDGQIQR